MTVMTYFDAVPHREMLRDYPIGPAFLEAFRRISRDELWDLQNRRFMQVVARGWEIPFYRRRWTARGLQPGDIRSLEDITKLPTYGKSDIMQSVEEYPPLGDFHGIDSAPAHVRPTIVLHTTSGTTGRPQPLLFGPKTREMQNLLLARAYLLQGLRADDVVHSVYGHGLVNGGHYIRETVLHFTGRSSSPPAPGSRRDRARRWSTCVTSAPRCSWASSTTSATWPTSRARWG